MTGQRYSDQRLDAEYVARQINLVSLAKDEGHAEANACVFAGRAAAGGILYLEGHDYACESCIEICDAHGIQAIVIGPPPEYPA